MPENDRPTSKERREARQQERINRLTEQRQREREKAGVDEPIDIGPLGSERKARIDAAINEGQAEDLLGGLRTIQRTYGAPEVDAPELPEQDPITIRDVRRQRRHKIQDALGRAGRALQGKEQTEGKLDRAERERGEQYQQYLDSASQAKKTLQDWETGYIKEQLDYINKQIDDPATSELKKVQLEQARVRLEKEREAREFAREKMDWEREQSTV